MRDALSGNVFTIDPSGNFLEILVNSLIDGTLVEGFVPSDDPFLLSEATIFVPSRRAARALAAQFSEAFDGKPVLLPSIFTLGDAPEEDFGIASSKSEFEDLPEEIGALEKKLQLTKMVLSWLDAMSEETRRLYSDEDIIIPSSHADAIKLADDLSQLLDQVVQEEVSWQTIQEIVPEDHAQWWQLTLTFLAIITDVWPGFLEEQNLLDPSLRSAMQLEERTRRYKENGSTGPVIVAGSTGSVPSTQRLLDAVAKLEKGAVVLPGVDWMLPNPEWENLTNTKLELDASIETHPQFGLARLLDKLGVGRDQVKRLGMVSNKKEVRQALISMALSGSEFTDNWFHATLERDQNELRTAFENVALIEASNERQEALVIAIAMRETLLEPGKKAALVTPDRNLAHRVSMELKRFNLDVDDSAGMPLKNSRPALFLRSIVEIVFSKPSNSMIATFVKNPFCNCGEADDVSLKLGQLFELVALRGVIDQPIAGSFYEFLSSRRKRMSEGGQFHASVKLIEEEDWDQMASFAEKLDHALNPLTDLVTREGEIPLKDLFHQLMICAQLLAQDETGTSLLLEEPGGMELINLFDEMADTSANSCNVVAADFPSVFDALLSPLSTRMQGYAHPRLHIYGPLEVRLLNHDRVILAGLNEGTWPRQIRNDAFLNRLMRQQIGMATAERRIGLAAQDFHQLLGSNEVILTRATRVDKAPTVASRWVQRMTALMGEKQSEVLLNRGQVYLNYANGIDAEEARSEGHGRPCPTPPVEARPTVLPVTDIETWIRDPYALYAKRVLKLRPLDPLERDPDHLLKGTVYHQILQDYTNSFSYDDTSKARLRHLNELAKACLEQENLPPHLFQIWQLRFAEVAEQFVKWETKHHNRRAVKSRNCEIEGSLTFDDGNFRLVARADRIDVLEDGSVFVLDYKTGAGPSVDQAHKFSPQLALEGLIAREGGFSKIASAQLDDLVFIRLQRGDRFREQSIAKKDVPVDEVIENARVQLLELVTGYQSGNQGYISRRAPFRDSEMSNDYDHLARTREWSFAEDDGGDD